MSKSSRAHLLALEEAQVGTHKVYNLGNGSGYFVSEVVEAVRRITKCHVKIVEVLRRVGDPGAVVASSEKITAELG
jgi:UDP-glucose 4-epimerase